MRSFIRTASKVAMMGVVAGSLLALSSLATAKTTKLHAFGVRPNSNYEIRKNGGGALMVHSSAHGGIATTFDAIPGDRFTISNLVPVPVTPTIRVAGQRSMNSRISVVTGTPA